MNILTVIDMNKNEVRNLVIQNLATAPANPVEGQMYWNTVEKVLYQFNGTSWAAAGTTYVLPAATTSTLGGVKVGDGLGVANDGTISTNIQTVKVNGTPLTPDANKAVDVTVPTAVSDLTNDLGFQTASDVSTAISTATGNYLALTGGTMSGSIIMGGNAVTGLGTPSNGSDAATKDYVDATAVGALKPSGSIAFASLPALGSSVLNNLYNITDAFTTTSDFVDGSGKNYPAGTNVAIINTGTTASPVYKYDAMTGVIDTSSFATKTEVNGLITKTTGTIGASATTVTINYTGTLVNAYATQGGAAVITDMAISASSVVFTVATAPSAEITCNVISVGALS